MLRLTFYPATTEIEVQRASGIGLGRDSLSAGKGTRGRDGAENLVGWERMVVGLGI